MFHFTISVLKARERYNLYLTITTISIISILLIVFISFDLSYILHIIT